MAMRLPASVSLAFLVSSVSRLWAGVSAVGGVLSDTPETDTLVALYAGTHVAKTWSVPRLTHADVNQAIQDQTARQRFVIRSV